jgi:hypothetical protein
MNEKRHLEAGFTGSQVVGNEAIHEKKGAIRR